MSGLKAGCMKDPNCNAVADFGTKGKRCKGEVKFGDGTDDKITGMKGLRVHEGGKVFIKGRCKEDIIFNCHSLY